ncbi:MAG: paraquat-inducible protein B [Nitrospirales bacterium]|nr:MAG: paraquat-inducible protein B [Nitrospirales bacterium]
MSKRSNPTLIGTFVIGAIVLVVIGVLIFGGGKFFKDQLIYVLYFDDNLKGLSVGAPVTFRGTRIGSITEIKVVIDAQGESIRIPVLMALEEGAVEVVNTGPDTIMPEIVEEKDRAFLGKMIEDRGLRAQLQMQSLVTGKLLVQLDFFPLSPIKLHTGLDDPFPEFPTISSSLSLLTHKLEDIPIQDLAATALRAIQGLDQLLNSPDLKGLVAESRILVKDLRDLTQVMNRELTPVMTGLDETIRDTQRLVGQIDSQVQPLSGDFREVAKSARMSLKQTQETLLAIRGVAGKDSALPYQLTSTLKELKAAARSIRGLADYLEQHPEALLRGKDGQ